MKATPCGVDPKRESQFGNDMTEYGLIGKSIGHSFSATYFNEKFKREGIDARYDLYPLENIDLLPALVRSRPRLAGLNVTIPYKVEVMKYLDFLSEEAEAIGAVNVIKITREGDSISMKGFNSDAYGFSESLGRILREYELSPCENDKYPDSFVLGTGGASKAVMWSLKKMGFHPQLVGRKRKEGCIAYEDLTEQAVEQSLLTVNCTPLGTSPDVNHAAPFPYQYLHEGQVCFDLVYNPTETLFMRKAQARGCIVSNGLDMLHLQAAGAWRIWTEG